MDNLTEEVVTKLQSVLKVDQLNGGLQKNIPHKEDKITPLRKKRNRVNMKTQRYGKELNSRP